VSIGVTPQRYANVDGLRAIAALGVMIEHLFGDLIRQTPPTVGPMNAVADSVVQSLSLGRFGVALFFLISGFVVPFSIGGERPLGHFAISRLFRLYPAFWLALAVLATMAWLAGEQPSMATVLANMTMAPTLFSQPWLSPIYWTLFIELVFYVLVALLFSVGRLRNVGVLSVLSLALVAATVLPVQLRTHGIANLPVQYLGMHLSFLFLGLLLRLWLVERVQSARMLARIGLISYSMYLFHGSVNVVVYRLLPLTGQINDVAVMLICVALTLMLSLLVYRMVERPMIMLGRMIVLWRGVRSRS